VSIVSGRTFQKNKKNEKMAKTTLLD